MLKLSVITPDRTVLKECAVKSVTVPASNGEMTALPGHAELSSVLRTGIVSFEKGTGEKQNAAVSGGFFQIKEERAVLLAYTLELSSEIDPERARQAQIRAEEKLKTKRLERESPELLRPEHSRDVNATRSDAHVRDVHATRSDAHSRDVSAISSNAKATKYDEDFDLKKWEAKLERALIRQHTAKL